MRDGQGRLVIDDPLRALVRELARAAPDLAKADADRIVFVAGAARLAQRASIRPLVGADRPSVVIAGVAMSYEICLRPRFFLAASPDERIMIVAHELWHASPAFDGTLTMERRHRHAAREQIESEVGRIVEDFRASGSRAAEFLRFGGEELRMRAWLVRPPSRIPAGSTLRTAYDERDLFLALVQSHD